MSGGAGSRGPITGAPISPVMACRTFTASTPAPGAVSTTTNRGSPPATAANDGSAVAAKAITLTEKQRWLIPNMSLQRGRSFNPNGRSPPFAVAVIPAGNSVMMA